MSDTKIPSQKTSTRTNRNSTEKIVTSVLAYAESRLAQGNMHLSKVDRSWLTRDVATRITKQLDRINATLLALRANIASDFPAHE